MSERVFAVPRASVAGGNVPHGYWPTPIDEFGRLERGGEFHERAPVEVDPSLKQLIPYAIVVRDAEVFLFRRTKGGGEKRLHGLRSIGVGGHVNPVDAHSPAGAGGAILDRALERELHEELVLPGVSAARFVGLLNDDSTAVGSVHLGVVAVVEPAPGSVLVREHDTMTGGFVHRDELRAMHRDERDSFESWSALLIDKLDEVLACPTPHTRTLPLLKSPGAADWSTPTPSETPTSTT